MHEQERRIDRTRNPGLTEVDRIGKRTGWRLASTAPEFESPLAGGVCRHRICPVTGDRADHPDSMGAMARPGGFHLIPCGMARLDLCGCGFIFSTTNSHAAKTAEYQSAQARTGEGPCGCRGVHHAAGSGHRSPTDDHWSRRPGFMRRSSKPRVRAPAPVRRDRSRDPWSPSEEEHASAPRADLHRSQIETARMRPRWQCEIENRL